jgi:3-keto-5-aminohexanoate cleavage enzyme
MNCIVNFTPTGMMPTREMSQFVPLSVKEIVEDVLEAADIGITTVHLHARDPKTEQPAYKAEIYAEIISGIRKFNKELVICVSLTGRTFQEFHKRAEPLILEGDLKPDMGSLTLSSVNFNKQACLNAPDMIDALVREMNARGIMPELEAFDAGMINYARYLEKKGLLRPPHYFNLILGNIACAQADLLHAGIMIRDLPPDSFWSLGGIGDYQLPMNAIAIAAGGGVRVGLEDNIWFDKKRTRLASNVELIRRVHKFIEMNGREVMKPAEMRKLLMMENGYGKYGRRMSEAHKDHEG